MTLAEIATQLADIVEEIHVDDQEPLSDSEDVISSAMSVNESNKANAGAQKSMHMLPWIVHGSRFLGRGDDNDAPSLTNAPADGSTGKLREGYERPRTPEPTLLDTSELESKYGLEYCPNEPKDAVEQHPPCNMGNFNEIALESTEASDFSTAGFADDAWTKKDPSVLDWDEEIVFSEDEDRIKAFVKPEDIVPIITLQPSDFEDSSLTEQVLPVRRQ